MSSPRVYDDVNLPRDQSAASMHVLGQAAIANGAVGSASAALALPSNSRVGVISANTDMWYLFGDNSVSVSNSTGMFLLAGQQRAYDVSDYTHVATIRDSADGRVAFEKLS